MTRQEILGWLREEDPGRLDELWTRSDAVRREHVGDAVHLRGLVEISNHCVRRCAYCGLRQPNQSLARYRMTAEEVMACAREAETRGYGTVVLQSGEDPGLNRFWVADLVAQIKRTTKLAVTLSLGERAKGDLWAWREAGADRYLARFETSDKDLYEAIHPSQGSRWPSRIPLLEALRSMGYEVGSGTMVGIPGQTYGSVADDVLIFKELDLDMIGIGPYIPHWATPLGSGTMRPRVDRSEQVPNSELMVYKVIALARVVRPDANIPSTTALATINPAAGRELGLRRGANVVMPNLTPLKYRKMYEIYPNKTCMTETGQQCDMCLRTRIAGIGREVGTGPGSRRKVS